MIRNVGLGFALLAFALVAGCAGETSGADESMEEADLTGGKKVVADKTTSFSGTFAFKFDGENVKMSFDVSRIDWESRTAVFDSTIVSAGNADVSEDRKLEMSIAVARCPGCYTFDIEQDGEIVVSIAFERSALKSIVYSGYPTTGAKITTASEAPLADESRVPEGVGKMCGGFAGTRCPSGLRCDNSLGLNTGRCVQ